MLSNAAREFILHVTHYFNGHWEDPEWGRRPVNQLLIGLAIRELAEGLGDAELRGQVQTAADRAIAANAKGVAAR